MITVDLATVRLANRARRWAEQLDSPDATPRDKRFAMLSFLHARLPHGTTTKYCFAYVRGDREHWSLNYSDHREHAHIDGVAYCGSVWACPVCSERITRERRGELKRLLAQTKLRIAMVTFTFSHGRDDDLETIVRKLNQAVRAMKSHRPWRRWAAKWGLVGHVHALEPTHGHANGWHPHRHELLGLDPLKFPLLSNTTRDRIVGEMQAELLEIYRAELAKVGLECDDEHGVKITANRREYGDYVSKWGCAEELTRSQNKQATGGGRSPWELLADAVRGDAQAWALFLEYCKAFKGRKQLHWSRGFRALLGLAEEETPDGEVANEDQDQDRPVVVGTRAGLRYLVDHDLLGPLLKYCELVRGDPVEVLAYLQRMGLRQHVMGVALEYIADLHPPNRDNDPPERLESIDGGERTGQDSLQPAIRGALTQWQIIPH